MWPTDSIGYEYPVDSIPTSRVFGAHMGRVKNNKYRIQPYVNRNGYIAVPENDPVVQKAKEDFVLAGDFSPSTYYSYGLLHELSKPVKEYLSVLFWKYLCFLGGIDMDERKPMCETCDL